MHRIRAQPHTSARSSPLSSNRTRRRELKTRLAIATLIYMMLQGFVFGTGVVLVLATPLAAHAMELMPWVVVASLIVAAPLSWWLAPRLRARYWRTHPEERNPADRMLSTLS